MNIGIFTDTFFPQISGVATSTRMLERELSRLGHRVFIFTTSDPDVEYSVPRVFRLPSMPVVFIPARRITFMYPPKLIIKMKSLDLDVIHTQTEFPLGVFGKLVSEFYNLPMVHTYHTMYEDYLHYVGNGHLLTPKMAQSYSRFFCNRADIVIAPVQKTRDYLIEIGVSRPIKVVPTGLDFSHFNRDKQNASETSELKKALGIDPSSPVIVSVGRIAKEKSVDVLIRQMPKLLARLPEAKLVIVGDGPKLADCQSLAQTLGVDGSVVFTGAKPWEIIPLYYQLGDIFATASTSETQGLTYIEAMAGRVPVAAKRDRSSEGVLTDGKTGYVFENDEEAADVFYRALTRRDEARGFAENGLKAITGLSSAQFGKNAESIYTEAVSKYSARRRRRRNTGLRGE